MVNMVNATFATWLFKPPVFWYANVAFTIRYHLCHIFTPQHFTYLRHICNEQICAPFFRPLTKMFDVP